MHNPYAIRIEAVRGCTQRCPFCSLSAMDWKDEPFKFMDFGMFQHACNELSTWLPKHRMEWAERGEPTMHPKLIDMVAYARQTLPKAQLTITTNGDKQLSKQINFREYVLELFQAGANIIMLDCYWQERYDEMTAMFPEAKDFFADEIHPYTYRNPKYKEIIIVDATPGKSNTIRWYQNQGGTVDIQMAARAGFEIPIVTEPLQKMCVKPFRELSLHWDGTVPICCNDWLDVAVAGRFPDVSLEELWFGELNRFRRPLLNKDRAALSPCDKCSERSGFRVGLEMNWFGDRQPKKDT
jgi:hypothetical protein